MHSFGRERILLLCLQLSHSLLLSDLSDLVLDLLLLVETLLLQVPCNLHMQRQHLIVLPQINDLVKVNRWLSPSWGERLRKLFHFLLLFYSCFGDRLESIVLIKNGRKLPVE